MVNFSDPVIVTFFQKTIAELCKGVRLEECRWILLKKTKSHWLQIIALPIELWIPNTSETTKKGIHLDLKA